jgi:CubicO group peptidase (beta-lactamase class C family)
LGDVIARVSGESLDSYLQSAIFRPLGMVNCTMTLSGRAAKQGATQYDQKTHVRSSSRVSGHEGASGLHCSARDLLSFGMFQLRKYSGSDSPLSDRDIQDMHLAQPGTQGQYGLGWWIGRQAGIEIISAQGGTSNAYALLELVPAKDIVVVVVANSYSQLVSRLENQILSVLLGFPVEVQSSSPQLAQASSGPDALSGKWSGQILTYQGPINVTLDIAGTGGTQIQIGDRRAALVTNSSFEPNHFYGQLRAEPGLPDSPRQTFMIELELALRGDKLIGAATFVSLPEHGGDGDQLPHFMSLARANQ